MDRGYAMTSAVKPLMSHDDYNQQRVHHPALREAKSSSDLSLRKKSSRTLRSGDKSQSPTGPGPPWMLQSQKRVASDSRVLPSLQTNRESSRDTRPMHSRLTSPGAPRHSPSSRGGPSPRDFQSPTPSRPSSAQQRHADQRSPSSPRLLRTSTSIPDYRSITAAFDTASNAAEQRREERMSLEVLETQEKANRTSAQESLRSALTNGTSATERSLTRSSLRTDHSSDSDPDNLPMPATAVQGHDMTVEDAIAMYSNGFSDEPATVNHVVKTTKPFHPSPLFQYHAVRPASKDGLRSVPAGPEVVITQSGPKRASVSAVAQAGGQMAGLMAASHDHALPLVQDRLKALIGPTGPPRDRYGFKKESQHVTIAMYDAWDLEYTKYLQRRRKRWEDYMKQHGLPTEYPTRFPPRSEKTKRYIRKGIPPEWRGAAWFFYAGGPQRLAEYPDHHYHDLHTTAGLGAITKTDKDHIERDLYRTFPDHIKFKPDSAITHNSSTPTAGDGHIETPMIASLRRILQAFALANPKTGYCQSLNFLAGFLLIFLDNDEEKAYHLLCILTEKHLPGTHGLSLEGANVDIGVLMMCLKESMPALWRDKIDDRADTTVSLAAGDMRVSTGLPTVSLATTGWFMSCFSSTLPFETTSRVWDCLFYEGSKTLFRVGLAIFKLSEREIRKTGDEPMEVFQVIQTLPKSLLDANLLVETATKKSSSWSLGGGSSGFGTLSQKAVERRREDRRRLYKAERERVLLKVLTSPVGEDGLEERLRSVGEKEKGKTRFSPKGKR